MQRRRRILGLGLAAPAAAALAGCARRIPLDRDAARAVRRVGLVTPRVPSEPISDIRLTPGAAFGLVGGLIDLAMALDRQRVLKEALDSQGFEPAARLEAALAAALVREGYEVVRLAVARPSGDFLARYPEAPVDAYLDVVVQLYGHVATSVAAPFHPMAIVGARLAAAPSGRPLLEEEFRLYPAGHLLYGEHVRLEVDERHAVATTSDVEARPAPVAAGMEDAMLRTADRIVLALR